MLHHAKGEGSKLPSCLFHGEFSSNPPPPEDTVVARGIRAVDAETGLIRRRTF